MNKILSLILVVTTMLTSFYFFHVNKKPVNSFIGQSNLKQTLIQDCTPQKNPRQCWEQAIKSAINTQGLGAAFDLIAQLYATQPVFASECHSYTHELGQAAYFLFKKDQKINLGDKTSYCGFGFYHGFMETLINNGGQIQEARDFCSYAGRVVKGQGTDAEGSCYHGIGHGAVDGSDPRTWGNAEALIASALDMCKKVALTDTFLLRCTSGIFNSLAIMYSTSQYKLVVDKSNPFGICAEQSSRPIKSACYGEMNTFILHYNNEDLKKVADFLKLVREKEYLSLTIEGVATYIASYALKNGISNDKVIEFCRWLDSASQPSCMQGFGGGLIEFGSPTLGYVSAINFCSTKKLTEAEANACFTKVLWLAGVYYPKERQAEICAKVEEKYKQHCVL